MGTFSLWRQLHALGLKVRKSAKWCYIQLVLLYLQLIERVQKQNDTHGGCEVYLKGLAQVALQEMIPQWKPHLESFFGLIHIRDKISRWCFIVVMVLSILILISHNSNPSFTPKNIKKQVIETSVFIFIWYSHYLVQVNAC